MVYQATSPESLCSGNEVEVGLLIHLYNGLPEHVEVESLSQVRTIDFTIFTTFVLCGVYPSLPLPASDYKPSRIGCSAQGFSKWSFY